MTREKEFNSRMELVESMIEVGSSFSNINIHEHPSVIAQVKQHEEELKEEAEELGAEAIAEPEDEEKEQPDADYNPEAKSIMDEVMERFGSEYNLDQYKDDPDDDDEDFNKKDEL